MKTTLKLSGRSYKVLAVLSLAALIFDDEVEVCTIGENVVSAMRYTLERLFDRMDEEGGLGASPEEIDGLLSDMDRLTPALRSEAMKTRAATRQHQVRVALRRAARQAAE